MYTSLYGANTSQIAPAQSAFNQYQDPGLRHHFLQGVPTSQSMPLGRSFGGSFSQPASPITAYRGSEWSVAPLSGPLDYTAEAGIIDSSVKFDQITTSNSTGQVFFPLPPGLTTPTDFSSTRDTSMSLNNSASEQGLDFSGNFQVTGPPVSPGLCSICQDKATGKHYGANSCDGCKGFFRRTIRKRQKYSCRFDRNCMIDRDKRNSCRYCRFQKCIHAGMRKDAVQNERDRIMSKKPATRIKTEGGDLAEPQSPFRSSRESPDVSTDGISERSQEYIELLMKAEAICSQLRASVITRTADRMPAPTNGSKNTPMLASSPTAQTQKLQLQAETDGEEREATVNDVTNSMHQQLLLMVEWAKTLSPFSDLVLDDQIALLRNYAAQHLLICVAHRSRNGNDQLFLTNESCLPRKPSAEIPDVNHVTVRVLDELVEPIKNINIDESEFVCLRALVFFNPNARGLVDQSAQVSTTRQSILLALNEYTADKYPNDKCRFGNLLLLLPPLQAIAQNLIEDLQLASLFGMARIDSLLQELLLSEESEIGKQGQSACNTGSTVEISNDDFFSPVQVGAE